MTTLQTVVVIVVVAAIAPVLLSLIVEGLRRQPEKPAWLYWSDSIPIQYVNLDGVNIRYVQAGKGPKLVLLHTLRTQLDIFHKVLPELAQDFTVYALDYPGHGFSDIPQTEYIPELFVETVEKFLDKLDITDATLAGISIGGSIPLLIAARHNPRIRKAIAINPYDYGGGRGVERGNFVAWLIFTLARIPVLGETVMRFRNTMVEKIIMQGGVAHPDALTGGFLKQLWDSGLRTGHYRGFINLVRNSAKWEEARKDYTRIKVPVVLVYGEKDWSRDNERKRNLEEIPGARLETVKNGGHFLSLDRPDEVIRLIKQYAP